MHNKIRPYWGPPIIPKYPEVALYAIDQLTLKDKLTYAKGKVGNYIARVSNISLLS